MHLPTYETSDTWVLQEKCVYTFQQSQGSFRKRDHAPVCQTGLQSSGEPDIVLLSLWPQAVDHQVQRYLTGYRELYPGARVILSRTGHSTASTLDDADYHRTLNELIDAQPRSAIYPSRLAVGGILHKTRPSVLLHLFGSSGAADACKLLRGFRLRTDEPLNVGAVIADTEPSASLTTFFTSYQPISSTLFSVLLALWMRLQAYMFFWPPKPHTGQIHQDLNDPYLLPADARKCFVFAQRGLMLTWMKASFSHHATKRASDTYTSHGISSGLELWNDEQDERREHVFRRSSIDQKGRWSGDQEQYWSGIENVWEGR